MTFLKTPDYACVSLPYTPDSAPLMLRLAAVPNPAFFDSGGFGTETGRYDILTAAPVATVTLNQGHLTSSAPLPPESASDIWSAGRYLLARYAVEAADSDDDMPFSGGLAGCLGYPRLRGKGTHHPDDAFVGLYPWALVVDHKQRTSRVRFQAWCPAETREQVMALLHSQDDRGLYFNLLEEFHNDTSEADYGVAFDRIKAYIDAGDCYQVNLTQRFSSRFSGQPLAAYLRLRRDNGKPFSAFFQWSNRALLSLSPERFLAVDGSKVTTQPIKGTRPRGDSPEQDRRLAQELQDSEKDRAENLMIVDLLRNDLGTLCEYGSIQAGPLFELRSFDNVHHLVSTVTGTLRNAATPLKLLQNCFPGGSITGAPKLRAMEIIEELEPQQRSLYCGSAFYLGMNGRMDSSITIRSVECRGDRIYCWAGGGIVADSYCAQEYNECFDKIRSLIKTLQR